MNFRAGNVFRELSYSLRRNPSLFIGTLLVIWIALLLLGGSLMVRSAASSATERWKDGVEFIVFLNPDASQVQIDAVRDKLAVSPEIASAEFFDKNAAFAEFEVLFSDSEQILDAVTVEDMPPSFRAVPVNSNSDVVEALADGFRADPGVFQVTVPLDAIRDIESVSEDINTTLLIGGVLLLVAAILLVYNTIRTTVFSRRREVEVMRLVGASNWYIRIPFMIEGVIQGLLAGVITLPFLRWLNNGLGSLGERNSLQLLDGLRASSSDQFQIWILLTVLGGTIGMIASAVALSRYLDV